MEQVLSYIDEHSDSYVDELVRVCRQPSVSATGEGINEMAEIVQSMLVSLGAETRLIPTEGNPIVYSRLPGRSSKTLMFYNHYDVQPPGSRDEWNSDPFGAEIRNGTIYSRGVADNKGNIVCRIKAVEAILETKGALPVSVIFVIEGEEEMGSPHLEVFARSHADLLKADGIIWEGGFKDLEDRLEIYLGVSGWCGIELRTKTAGDEMHSMFAAVAPSALWNVVRILNSLQDRDGTVLVPGFYDDVRPPSAEDLRLVEQVAYDWETFKKRFGISELAYQGSDLELMTRHLFRPAVNISGLSGGYTGTGYKALVPDEAVARIGVKLVPDQAPDDILVKLERHIRGSGIGQIEIETVGSIPPYRAPIDSEISRATIAAAKDVYGQAPLVFPLIAGASPMHKLAGQLGIPAVMVGCASSYSNIHAPDENLRIAEDFLPGIKHVAAVIEHFAGYNS